MRQIELLSPARNIECGIEAIRHGADAVYIGAPKFSARATAGNSLEDIAELVRFAHGFAARIYVALNTLLTNEELREAVEMAKALRQVDVDALIVQDSRLRKLLQGIIPLHASTQMDNRTVAHVKALAEAGYEQVVLARELSLEQIHEIHEAVPEVALEAFVHGALCVCYSGCCYASEYAFGRSANRGECAQFCRLPFDVIDTDGKTLQHQKHVLSLLDMNRSDDLEAMMDAGITSFKIEGRLKDVAYVKNVTAYYRQKIDAIIQRRSQDRSPQGETFCRSSLGISTYTFTPNPLKSFNRGFTDYFLRARGARMANFATPKSLGEPLTKDATPLQNGDGICYIDERGELQGFRINNASQVPHPSSQRLLLFRNFDQAFERILQKPSAQRKIPVRWRMEKVEDGFHLTLSGINTPLSPCASHCSTHETFPCSFEPAKTPQRENIIRQLLRLGDTNFCATSDDVELAFEGEWFIPSSVLSEWRRTMTEALAQVLLLRAAAEMNPKVRPEREQVDKTENLPYDGKYSGEQPLMTCRYCLKYEMGYCTKQKKAAPWKEPLSLVLRDGRRFQLQFDCKRCEMQVLKP